MKIAYKKYKFLLYFFLVFLSLFGGISVNSGFSQVSKFEEQIVRRIEIIGNESVSTGDLLHNMRTAVGFPLRSIEVRQDIKSMFEKGRFEKVDVEIEEVPNGVRLRFVCVERPRIQSIEFKGNDEIIDSELQTAILLKDGDVFRRDLIERSIRNIEESYRAKGFYNAVIDYRVIPMANSRNVRLRFIIDEGEKITVSRISIRGLRNFSVKEIRKVMETKEKGWFRDGIFNADVFEQDKDKILAFLRERGYLDAQIIEDRIEYVWKDPTEQDARGIFILITIHEGDIYYFDGYTIEIESDGEKPIFTPESLLKGMSLNKAGSIFNDTLFQRDRQMISFRYASEGFIFARVIPNREITEREVSVGRTTQTRKFVKIDFTINEGSKAYIDSIIIRGNKKTKENVIRRELVIKEGELFSSSRMQLSRERVFNLGYFKRVDFDVRPGSRDGYMNLIVDVEEQPSGTISLGGGYGTTSGFSIFADITENNFRGRGQIAGIKFTYGPFMSSITLSFIERWLFDKPIAFRSSISYGLYTYQESSIFPTGSTVSEYQKQTFGYSLGLSYRFKYFYQMGTTWYQVFKSYLNPTGNSPDYIFEYVGLGLQQKRAQAVYLYRDSKNNYLNPTSGSRVGTSVTFTGGFLGGNDHYVEMSPEAAIYYSPFNLPFLKTHPCVFELRANGTFMLPPFGNVKQDYLRNEWISSDDRLRLGGPETLRIWDYYDRNFPLSWEFVGLYHRITYGLEFRVPIHPGMLWLAFFFDAGSLWSDPYWERQVTNTTYRRYINNDKAAGDLYDIGQFFDVSLLEYFRYSYGMGFRIQIPMMPLRFWFGQRAIYDGDRLVKVGGIDFTFQIGDFRY